MISVIIPTLNSARLLPRAFAPLVDGVKNDMVREVIVADGGSTDDTLDVADAAGCNIVNAPRGRAKQIRAAVEASKGKYLMIHYPDTMLGQGWADEAKQFCALVQSRAKAAVFRLTFDDPSPAAKRAAFWARQRAKVMNLPYGEQGVLMSRFFYDGLGGYPDVATMDDVEFARRIGAKRWVLFETPAYTSALKLRHDDRSIWRRVALMARYKLGGDPIELAKAYDG
jgi:glycosyltransferase involved in cell wall biosynthesis